MPSSMLTLGPSIAGPRVAGSLRRARAGARRTAARRRPRRGRTAWPPTPSRPPTSARRANPSAPSTTTSDSADGSDPTATSQRLRNTRNSSGRISASDPTEFQMLSPPDDRFGFDGNAMTAGELDPHRRQRSFVEELAGSVPAAIAAQPRSPAVGRRARGRRPSRTADGAAARSPAGRGRSAVTIAIRARADVQAAARFRRARRAAISNRPQRILPNHVRHRRTRARASSSRLAATAARAPSGQNRLQRLVRAPAPASSSSWRIGEPAEDRACDRRPPASTRSISGAARSASTQSSIVVAVFGNRVALGRGEDDVQLIEVAEPADECPERRDDAAVSRQERQDVGVERQAANALDRDERRALQRRPASAPVQRTATSR